MGFELISFHSCRGEGRQDQNRKEELQTNTERREFQEKAKADSESVLVAHHSNNSGRKREEKCNNVLISQEVAENEIIDERRW